MRNDAALSSILCTSTPPVVVPAFLSYSYSFMLKKALYYTLLASPGTHMSLLGACQCAHTLQLAACLGPFVACVRVCADARHVRSALMQRAEQQYRCALMACAWASWRAGAVRLVQHRAAALHWTRPAKVRARNYEVTT